MERPLFASVTEYGARFTDVAYWRPYVEEVCRRHNLSCRQVRGGLAGTYPVYIVDERHVVKFFGDLFEGRRTFAVEMEVYRLLGGAPGVPVPALLAHGSLFAPGKPWSWPYIITRYIPGVSIGDVDAELSYGIRAGVAAQLGPLLHALHNLRLPASGPLQSSWDSFVRFLTVRRAVCVEHHRAWAKKQEGGLPQTLIEQIDTYLPPVETLIDRNRKPSLIHADLNADHVLGTWDGVRWQTTGIIDFGDARAGAPVYELPALHLGLFRCDKRLLRIFLDAYGWNHERHAGFARRAMSMTLLFEFGFGSLFDTFPEASDVASLEELARLLYDVETPGLPGSERP